MRDPSRSHAVVWWTLAMLAASITATARAEGDYDRYQVPLLPGFVVYVGHDGQGKVGDLSPGPNWGMGIHADQVKRVAVAGKLIVGDSGKGFFIYDTTSPASDAHYYATDVEWKAALADHRVNVIPPLSEPKALMAGVPDRALRPWNYRTMRGALGWTDDDWAAIVVFAGLGLSFIIGLRSTERGSPGVAAFLLALLLVFVGPICIAGGGPPAGAGLIMWPIVYPLVARMGRAFRRKPRRSDVVAACAALAFCVMCRSTGASPPPEAVKIIFDTDMDSDCDDVGAIAVLHALADNGEAEILATTVSSINPWSPPCLSAINRFYGRGSIPLGVAKGPGGQKPTKYAKAIAERFPHDLKSADDAPDAVAVWRNVLRDQPDQSVTIVTVGYLTNVASLLRTPAEGGLPSGIDLARAKVKRWVCMGGNFIGSPPRDDLKLGNVNFTVDKASALYAIRDWPGRLTFVGREIGSIPSGLKVGKALVQLPDDHPLRLAYQLYGGRDVPVDRHVADPTTVLFAVRGLRDYWTESAPGHLDLQPDMTFTWQPPATGMQTYLLKRNGDDGKPNDRYIERTIEGLMLQPPHRGN